MECLCQRKSVAAGQPTRKLSWFVIRTYHITKRGRLVAISIHRAEEGRVVLAGEAVSRRGKRHERDAGRLKDGVSANDCLRACGADNADDLAVHETLRVRKRNREKG